MTRLGPGRATALFLAAAALAIVGGALVFEHGLGYVPCKLCLQQRIPHYVAIPLGLVTAAAPPGFLRRSGFAILALIFAASAFLGGYHAGVEWGFWPGPADCGGGGGAPPAGVDDFLRQLGRVHVVSCTDAAWRFAGLSLAGWNAVLSLGLAGVALAGWRRASTPAGAGRVV